MAAFFVIIAMLMETALPLQAEVVSYDAQTQEKGSAGITWPAAPSISAEGAILMDVDSETILYGRNIDERLYPASTTKLMTCLIAAERLDMKDTVTFSYSAVHDVPPDGSNIGMDSGETITVEQCLYGIMVGSANECASAIAEKTAGSVEAFTDLMNQRAAELGCTGTHFVNANGLFDENHYTTPHDLCLIGRAFLDEPALEQIGNTASYHFFATDTQPDDFWILNKHKLINGEYRYPGIIGGKTGFTSQSKETLVTGCIRNGMRLVCVVMKEEDPVQFEDTMTLFDYGFSEFERKNAAENDKTYTVSTAGFLSSGRDLFGNSSPAFSIAEDAYLTMPKSVELSDLNSRVTQDNSIVYTLPGITAGDILEGALPAGLQAGTAGEGASGDGENTDGIVIGRAKLVLNEQARNADKTTYIADTTIEDYLVKEEGLLDQLKDLYVHTGINGTVYVNLPVWIYTAAGAALLIVILMNLFSFLFSFGSGRSSRSYYSSYPSYSSYSGGSSYTERAYYPGRNSRGGSSAGRRQTSGRTRTRRNAKPVTRTYSEDDWDFEEFEDLDQW